MSNLGECKKCGWPQLEVKYVGDEVPHLWCKCSRCRYGWSREPLDAEPKGNAHPVDAWNYMFFDGLKSFGDCTAAELREAVRYLTHKINKMEGSEPKDSPMINGWDVVNHVKNLPLFLIDGHKGMFISRKAVLEYLLKRLDGDNVENN